MASYLVLNALNLSNKAIIPKTDDLDDAERIIANFSSQVPSWMSFHYEEIFVFLAENHITHIGRVKIELVITTLEQEKALTILNPSSSS